MPCEATLIMVPRERYTAIPFAIESLYENTKDTPFELIYVDGALPPRVRERVERESKERGFTFIHKDYQLMDNEARNIGLQHATTPYVVFADNDVTYTPNWLQPLVDAAKEYDAWLVGPTILDGNFPNDRIHAAGGDSYFETVDGKRRYHFKPGFGRKEVGEVHEEMRRGPTTMLEFHVLLARRDIFDTIGPLDERITTFADHDDLCVTVLEAGGTVIFEPASTVVYYDPGTNPNVLEPEDFPIFFLRWSDQLNGPSIDHAAKKWNLDPEDPWINHAKDWVTLRRRRCYKRLGLRGRLVGFTMHNISKSLGLKMEKALCERYTKPLMATRANKPLPGAPRPAVT